MNFHGNLVREHAAVVILAATLIVLIATAGTFSTVTAQDATVRDISEGVITHGANNWHNDRDAHTGTYTDAGTLSARTRVTLRYVLLTE